MSAASAIKESAHSEKFIPMQSHRFSKVLNPPTCGLSEMINKCCNCGCGRAIDKDKTFAKGHSNTFFRRPIAWSILWDHYFVWRRSQRAIAKTLGVSQWSISQRLREYGIPTRKKTWKIGQRKYRVNSNFFSSLGEEQAWTLGWLLSDGFIHKANRSFGIKVNEKDKDVLIKIRALLDYDGPLLPTKTYLKKTGKYYNHRLLQINAPEIVKRLNYFGLTSKKTHQETFLEVIKESKDENIIRNFIKGVFEGDGSIIFTKNSLLFQIVGTKELLSDIQRLLMEFTSVSKTKLTRNSKQGNHWALRYRGNKQAMRIFDWLYTDSKLHLNRKYEKYLQIKEVLTT